MLSAECVLPGCHAILTCGDRRFSLCFTQEYAVRMCTRPGCHESAVDEWVVIWCRSHLGELDAAYLGSLAYTYGGAVREQCGSDPHRWAGQVVADDLTRAAVGYGGAADVIASYLRGAFYDPEDWADPECPGAGEARRGRDRERQRLRDIAEQHAFWMLARRAREER